MSEKETLQPGKQPLTFQTPVAAKAVQDTWKEVARESEHWRRVTGREWLRARRQRVRKQVKVEGCSLRQNNNHWSRVQTGGRGGRCCSGHFREWTHSSPWFLLPDISWCPTRLWKEIKKGRNKQERNKGREKIRARQNTCIFVYNNNKILSF